MSKRLQGLVLISILLALVTTVQADPEWDWGGTWLLVASEEVNPEWISQGVSWMKCPENDWVEVLNTTVSVTDPTSRVWRYGSSASYLIEELRQENLAKWTVRHQCLSGQPDSVPGPPEAQGGAPVCVVNMIDDSCNFDCPENARVAVSGAGVNVWVAAACQGNIHCGGYIVCANTDFNAGYGGGTCYSVGLVIVGTCAPVPEGVPE